jgi:hypothetical protein
MKGTFPKLIVTQIFEGTTRLVMVMQIITNETFGRMNNIDAIVFLIQSYLPDSSRIPE